MEWCLKATSPRPPLLFPVLRRRGRREGGVLRDASRVAVSRAPTDARSVEGSCTALSLQPNPGNEYTWTWHCRHLSRLRGPEESENAVTSRFTSFFLPETTSALRLDFSGSAYSLEMRGFLPCAISASSPARPRNLSPRIPTSCNTTLCDPITAPCPRAVVRHQFESPLGVGRTDRTHALSPPARIPLGSCPQACHSA